MATSTPLAEAAAHSRSLPRRNPVVVWHLLSFDAPTVAALWTWFVALANGIHLPAASVAAMAIAVWMLYVTDRLLDTRAGSRSMRQEQELEERHYFHRLHSRSFAAGIVLAGLVLAALLRHLSPGSLHLYLLLGAMLFAYFVSIHSSTNSRRLPKEIAVGVFFSAATFIPTVSRQPNLRLTLLPDAILFAVLCSLNCLFIYIWEHPRPLPRTYPPTYPATHPATEAALRFLPIVAFAAVVASLALSLTGSLFHWRIPLACALSVCLLLSLHLSRHRCNPTTLRAAADLCLLTPILFLYMLHR